MSLHLEQNKVEVENRVKKLIHNLVTDDDIQDFIPVMEMSLRAHGSLLDIDAIIAEYKKNNR